ncbi:hypothetical protein Hsero_4624 [Herbaspirillum seropedicae SmR1]|uniref:Uncharacterized protein n=1 Tax=Herbaspirillum seropedicae (strain SmR1) TaxID=757424 RepID=D8IXW8_HERSS|nr:hypothetical protein Hsero_4624 [Herbaspirillum seropedicae SmR1]
MSRSGQSFVLQQRLAQGIGNDRQYLAGGHQQRAGGGRHETHRFAHADGGRTADVSAHGHRCAHALPELFQHIDRALGRGFHALDHVAPAFGDEVGGHDHRHRHRYRGGVAVARLGVRRGSQQGGHQDAGEGQAMQQRAFHDELLVVGFLLDCRHPGEAARRNVAMGASAVEGVIEKRNSCFIRYRNTIPDHHR